MATRVHPLDTANASIALIQRTRENAETGIHQMTIDVASLVQLVVLTAAWESLYRMIQFFALRRFKPKDRETDTFVRILLPSHGVSTAHALFMTWQGVNTLITFWDAPPTEKYLIVPGCPSYASQEWVELLNWLFLAYLTYDLGHVLFEYPRLGGKDTVAHHVAYMIASVVAGLTRSVPFAFGWLILTELSTPFLNVRWLIKNLRKHGSPRLVRLADSWGTTTERIEHWAGAAFFVAFTLVRIVSYGVFLGHFWYVAYRGDMEALPKGQLWLLLGLVTAGWVMNVFWWRILFAIVTGKRKSGGGGRVKPSGKE